MIGRVIFKAASKLSGKQKAGLAKAIRASALKRGAGRVGRGVKSFAKSYVDNSRRRRTIKAGKVLQKYNTARSTETTLKASAKTAKDNLTIGKTQADNLRVIAEKEASRAASLTDKLNSNPRGLVASLRKRSLRSANKDLARTNSTLELSKKNLASLENNFLNSQTRAITAERQADALLKQYTRLSKRESTAVIAARGLAGTALTVGAGVGAYQGYSAERERKRKRNGN